MQIFTYSHHTIQSHTYTHHTIRILITQYNVYSSHNTITQYRYTMSGPEEMDEDGHERGLISRAVDMIFDEVEALRFKGWTYDVSVSHLEIYNENLRDLMAQPSQELCVLLLVCGAACCSVLPCVAVRIRGIAWRRRRTICADVVLCCSVLQRVAACCSALQ